MRAVRHLSWIPPFAFLTAFSWLGVLGGHVLTYQLLQLDHRDGAGMHAWMHYAGAAMPMLLVVTSIGLVFSAVMASTEVRRWLSSRTPRRRMVHAALCASAAYTAIEILERVASHEPPPVIHELAIGIAIQAVLAALVVLVACGIAQMMIAAVESICCRRDRSKAARRPKSAARPHWSLDLDTRLSLLASGSVVKRGPPG